MLKEGFAEAYCKGEIENDSSSLNFKLIISKPSQPLPMHQKKEKG
jgi:hypothetical protein